MVTDEIVDRVHQARAALIKKYGGFDGWFRHLQSLDRRDKRAKKRPAQIARSK